MRCDRSLRLRYVSIECASSGILSRRIIGVFVVGERKAYRKLENRGFTFLVVVIGGCWRQWVWSNER